MAPTLVGLGVFLLYPLIAAVYLSFTRVSLLTPPQWLGLANYRRILTDPSLHQAARNTLWLVVVMVPARIVGAIGTGTLLTSVRRASGVYRTLFYLPALAPPVAATLAFAYTLKPGVGPVNTLLGKLGISGPLWFNSATWSKPSLVLLALWGVGDLTVLFLAALLDVPRSYYEAAEIDGANAWQRFRHITLPSISPVITFAAVTGIIQTLQYFTQAAVAGSVAYGQATTGGGSASSYGFPEGSTYTFPLYLYVAGFEHNLLGYANALAVLLFVVAFAVTLVLLRRSKSFSDGGPA